MRSEDFIKNLLSTIQKAIDRFQGAITDVQKAAFDEISDLAKQLDVKGSNIVASIRNVKTIGKLANSLEKVILSNDYLANVHDFLKAFYDITDLQNKYFSSLVGKFTAPAVLASLKDMTVEATIEGLTEAGIQSNVIEGITEILRTNITAGGKFSDLMDQMRDFIVGSGKVPGAMARYTQQLTTDALNQYSAQYNQMVTDHLELEWFQYVGTLLTTSRLFCRAMINKKFVHKSEFAEVVAGNFDEFRAIGGKLSPATGLPSGMIPGTNKYNFPIYRGGYNCGHQLVPVSIAAVPESATSKIKS